MSHDVDENAPAPKRSKVAVIIALVVVVCLLGAVGYFGYTKFLAKGPDYTGEGHGEVTIQIAKGQSIPSMAEDLAKENVVKSAQAFVEAASGDARARGIQVGYYKMKLEMSAASALDLLTDPDNLLQGNVLVVEGAGMVEVIAEASKATKIPLADFQAVLKNPKAIGLPAYAGNPIAFGFFSTAWKSASGILVALEASAITSTMPAPSTTRTLPCSKLSGSVSKSSAEAALISSFIL
ncbi:MAG: endolytic transglycosylase MltG [Actinomycetes bacterium]